MLSPLEESELGIEGKGRAFADLRNLERLHEDGFVILKKAVSPSSQNRGLERAFWTVLHKAQGNGSICILLNTEGENDGLRVQTDAPRSVAKGSLAKLEAEMDQLVKRVKPHFLVRDQMYVASLAGCGRQQINCDEMVIPEDDSSMGLSLQVSLDGFQLLVFPGSIRGQYQPNGILLDIAPGDAILFRRDLVYAGAPSEARCMQVHCCLDSPISGPRHTNVCNLMPAYSWNCVDTRPIAVESASQKVLSDAKQHRREKKVRLNV